VWGDVTPRRDGGDREKRRKKDSKGVRESVGTSDGTGHHERILNRF